MGKKFRGAFRGARMAGLFMSLAAILLNPGAGAQEPSSPEAPPQEELLPVQDLEPIQGDTAISEARQHFRLGVSLYEQGNFREALDQFNRALALDPDFEDAKRYRDDSQTQLNIGATGIDPSARPTFETFDPAALAQPGESPQLSAEEFKIQRVRELVTLGEQYLEYQFYEEAQDHFEQVLLIAPDNERAKIGLHEATLGLYSKNVGETQGRVDEQIEQMRDEIERMKLWPEGADGKGIRNPRIEVPRVDERVQEVKVRTRIEEVLENPVSVVFEDIHLRDILDFVTGAYDINIVVDNRVVRRPRPAGGGAAGGQPPVGAQPPQRVQGGGNQAAFANLAQQTGGAGGQGQQQGLEGDEVTTGMIEYINVKDVTLREALKAILHPLNLDYSIQESFVWISSPEKIRTETFENLETRIYDLKYAGAESLFKLLLTNEGGPGQQFSLGNQGGGGGGVGGGQGGGGGGFGGGGGGGGGGFGGGGGGGFGGGGGGQGGGVGGGGQGGGTATGFANISELFDTIDDEEVGEFPNPLDEGIADAGGTGAFGGGGGQGAQGFGGQQGQQGQQGQGFGGGPGPGLGFAEGFAGESTVIQMIRSLIPPVIEPVTLRLLSYMRYNLITNQFVVHQTPSNHDKIKQLLDELDIRPTQVAIEAKFLTLQVSDEKAVGFNWEFLTTDPSNPPDPTAVPDQDFDVDGDGDIDTIPGNLNPDGSVASPFDYVAKALEGAGMFSPGAGALSFGLSIIDNANGDNLSVTFDALEQLGEAELLSAPRVTTMNQKPAVIADIVQEYFQVGVIIEEFLQTDSGDGGDGDNDVLFSSTIPIIQPFLFGFTLTVTPYISGDHIRMWLNPQVTDQVGTKTFTAISGSGEDSQDITLEFPTINTQSVWTNVVVSDGDTLVLGGLVRDSTLKTENKFPYLADIPVLGFFFRGKARVTSQRSLLIFVTPTIIDPSGARIFEPTI